LESWEPSQQLLIDTKKPKKTCVEMEICDAIWYELSTAELQSMVAARTKKQQKNLINYGNVSSAFEPLMEKNTGIESVYILSKAYWSRDAPIV
jgi:hypothetical protein